MPQFVPGVHSVKQIYEEGNHRLIAITGAEFFYIEFPIDVVMDVTFLPVDVIKLRSVSGNLKVQGIMKANQAGERTRVTYDARLQPSFWLPPILGPALIGVQIKRQFLGLIAEMGRRHELKQVEFQGSAKSICR
jgi:hypothetical protein